MAHNFYFRNGQYFDWNQFNHNMQAMQNRLQQNLGNMQTKINNQVQKELAEAAQRGFFFN